MDQFYLSCLIAHISFGAVLNQIGRLYIPDSGLTGAENVAIVPEENRLFIADGANLGLNVLKMEISNDYQSVNLTFEDMIFFSSQNFVDLGLENVTVNDITSVDYNSKNGFLVTCIVPDEYYKENGWLAIIDPKSFSMTKLIELPGCNLPDHVTVTKDGDLLIVSCEGEPDDDGAKYPTYNPEGSIAIVNVTDSFSVTNVVFTDFNSDGDMYSYISGVSDIYLPHLDATVAQNIEPEYASCDYQGEYCYIALQENNAVAVLDVENKKIIAIYSLGVKDYSKYPLDASDKDGIINIVSYPELYGLRMADNIKYFQSESGREYFVTANEGASKDFDEERVVNLNLDQDTFGNLTKLQNENNLGRLKVINQMGYELVNGTKLYKKLYAFSSRDFTAFEISDNGIEEIFSSQSDFENITANQLGIAGFNCDDYNPSFDKRSDDKGSEPECIMIGKCSNGRIYIFIGLERVGGIMVYDATFIDYDGDITFVEYINNRNFSIEVIDGHRASEEAGDIGPEQIRFVDESVYGVPLLIVASAESASVTLYSIDCGEEPSFPTTNMTEKPDTANSIKYIGAMTIMIIISMVFI